MASKVSDTSSVIQHPHLPQSQVVASRVPAYLSHLKVDSSGQVVETLTGHKI